MAEFSEAPRHKFVVGVHNPDVPNPWEYALKHDFDFACTFISRPQLEHEVLAQSPSSSQFDDVLFKNALLRPSGTSHWTHSTDRGRPCPPYARFSFAMA